ncbi:hypothetical protein [Nocardioides lijunqiniae]|uniref:hypothetical protein n=1 Tax=Nocardioides lijunqiniae TaxID=2760832 RepID=UPI00187764AF|nr:hypothetical protein [Nocardioides lijunqiniae]
MKRTKVLVTAAASGLVLTPLGWIPAMDAAVAAGQSAMSVQVRGLYSGDDLPGVQVTLYSTATGNAVGTRTTTDDDPSTSDDERGRVLFEGLDPGTYTAKAHDPSGVHSDRYSAARVINADDQWQGVEIALTPVGATVGRLSGTVTQDTSGDLDAFIEVYPSTVTTAALEAGTAQYVARMRVQDYANNYDDTEVETLTEPWDVKLAPGSYKVRVLDRDSESCSYVGPGEDYDCDFTRKTWVGGAAAETASTVKVTAGQTSASAATTLPAENVAGRERITGTVTGARGATLDDIEVELLERVGDRWVEVASTETGADGTFGFARGRDCQVTEYDYVYCDGDVPLDSGTFTLRFSDDDDYYYYYYENSGSSAEYATVFFGNVAEDPVNGGAVPGNVSTLTLGADDVVTAGASMTQIPLETTSGLYGKVTDDAGAAHRGRVRLFDTAGNQVSSLLTRRDGTWGLPVTALAPGQYKLGVDGEELVPTFVGGRSFRSGRTFSVPVKGATNAGSSLNARYVRLSGRVAVSGVRGVDTSETGVGIWSTDGRLVDSAETDAAGNFVATVVPGTYVLSADGEAWSSFDESDVRVSRQPLIERFWKSSWTLAGATRVLARSGARVTGVNLTLSNQLAAVAAPRISGTAAVRRTLTATTGAWNETEGVTYAYVWKRGSKVVSTRSTYKVTKKDRAKTLTLTVTASDRSGTYRAGSSSVSVKVSKKR